MLTNMSSGKDRRKEEKVCVPYLIVATAKQASRPKAYLPDAVSVAQVNRRSTLTAGGAYLMVSSHSTRFRVRTETLPLVLLYA